MGGLFKNYLLKPFCYALVIVATLFILNKFTSFNISLGSNNNYNTFEVVGIGKVTAVPNIAQTTFTINEKGVTQEDAKNAANTKQNQALSVLTALGIPRENIKTIGFYVNPNYDSTVQLQTQIAPVRPFQNGYVATITTQVKGSSADQVSRAIDKLTALGMNVGGVEYTYADKQQYINQAQSIAIANAKKQAQSIAKAAGFRLGKIVTIRNIDDQNVPQPYANSSLKTGAPNEDTSLQPGSNEVTARIGVTYYIKN